MVSDKENTQPAVDVDSNSSGADSGAASGAASGADFKWYVIHVHSGSEKSIVQAIKNNARLNNTSEYFKDFFVPASQITKLSGDKAVTSQGKAMFPGYILVQMQMNDRSWHTVRKTPKVTHFLGNQHRPRPISDRELQKIKDSIEKITQDDSKLTAFNVGESLKIKDGPFQSFVGVLKQIDHEKKKLKISVAIFGRETEVELDTDQVEKAE